MSTGSQSLNHNHNMKAIETKGKISVFKNLPPTLKTDKGVILNFGKLPKKELESLGYYDLVKPSIDRDTQSLGNVYFDKKKKVFTREIIEIDFDATYEDEDGKKVSSYDLDGKKAELIKGLKATSGLLLSSTDWQVVRLAERSIAIDSKVVSERKAILDKCEAKEIEVKGLKTYLSAIKYNTSFYTQQLDENGDVIVDERGNPILAI